MAGSRRSPAESDRLRSEVVTLRLPTVSVVIPTYNRRRRLEQVLGALNAQTYPRHRYEVVVVSDGCTDGTDEYLREHSAPDVTFVAQDNGGPASARNRGISVASGSLIVFIDDDVVATPELIQRHVDHHSTTTDELVVIGPMLTPEDAELRPWVAWEQAMLYRQYSAILAGEYPATPRQLYTGNASVGREMVVEVGGFDVHFRRAEDIELAYRLEAAGCRFVFDPHAIGFHYADRSFASWLQNAHDYGVVDAILARDRHRTDVGRIVAEGFQRRPAAVRSLTRSCLSSPRLDAVARGLFATCFTASRALRSERLTKMALSGLYNLSYYRGVADQLGGRGAFDRAVAQSAGEWT